MTHVKRYVAVFGALLALTLVTVAISYLQLPSTPTVALGLTIAAAKATLVALFFMHLKGERPMVFWPLALTAFLFAALFAFVLWTEADHIVLTTNYQLPTTN
jgi:cytochrome c oxidase subunit 4